MTPPAHIVKTKQFSHILEDVAILGAQILKEALGDNYVQLEPVANIMTGIKCLTQQQ